MRDLIDSAPRVNFKGISWRLTPQESLTLLAEQSHSGDEISDLFCAYDVASGDCDWGEYAQVRGWALHHLLLGSAVNDSACSTLLEQ
jgi:hypothetical protein